MITRRISQILIATALALAAVFGIAGIASAAFTSTSATAGQNVSTLRVQPPSNFAASCFFDWGTFGYRPSVSFAPSPTFTARPASSPVSPMGYQTVIKIGGAAYPDPQLTSSTTNWTGPSRGVFNAARTVSFEIAATYGNWTSTSVTTTFTC